MNKGPLLLAGSGEFTPAMLDVDTYWLRNIKNQTVAVIPTAAGREHDWWKWSTDGIAHYKKLNISAFGVKIQKAEDANDESIVKELERANVYYFSGGDPGYLLSVMKDSKAWKTIYERFTGGAALAGSSAGAMMLGSFIPENIRGVLEQGANKAFWKPAMNMVPYIIWPHYDWGFRMFGNKITKLMNEGAEKSPWLGIDENTAVIWEGFGKPIVKGKGQAHWGNADK